MPITVCDNEHRFHEKCVNGWLQSRGQGAKCPYCRVPIKIKEIAIEGGYKKRNRKTYRKRNNRKRKTYRRSN